MSTLLATLNHLLAAALAGQRSDGALTVRSVVLDETGARIIARVDHPACSGEVVLNLRADPAAEDGRQTLHLTVEHWPERLPPAAQALRPVLEKARVHIELEPAP